MADKAQAVKAAKKSPKATESKTSKFNFDTRLWPMGAKVAYTAERVAEHKGMTGVIVGYRPTNGLWVKFPNGKGSISVKTAKLVGSAPKPKASKKAKVEGTEPAAISGSSDSPAETPAS